MQREINVSEVRWILISRVIISKRIFLSTTLLTSPIPEMLELYYISFQSLHQQNVNTKQERVQ